MQPRSYVGGFSVQPQPQRVVAPSNQLAMVSRPPQQQIQVVGPNDPEAMMMMQVLQSFGAMGLPGFGPGLMSADPFEAFFDFSNRTETLRQFINNSPKAVSKAQMTSIEIGPDGRPIIENYFQNNLGQHMNGHTISEKQQAYRNTAGVNRIAEQRMLNQQGRKIIREKRGNDVEQTNHYFNIDAEQAPQFDSDWERVNRQNRFLEDHGRFLGYANCGPSMIEMGPPTGYQISGPTGQVRAIGPSFTQPQPAVQYSNQPMGASQQTGFPAQSIRSSVRQAPFVGQPPTSTPLYQPQTQAPTNLPQSRLAQNPFFSRQQGSGTASSSTLPSNRF